MLGNDERNSMMVDVAAVLFWVLVIVLIAWEELCHCVSVGRLAFSVVAIGYSGYAVVFFGNQIRMKIKNRLTEKGKFL